MAGHTPPPDPVFVLRGSEGAINTVNFKNAFNSEKPILMSGCTSGKIKLWNLKTRRTETTLDGHGGTGILWCDFISEDSILSQGRDCQIKVWHLAQDRQDVVRRISYESAGFCQCSFLQQGEDHLLAVPGKEPSVVEMFNVSTAGKIKTITPQEGTRALGMVMKLQLFSSPKDGRIHLLAGYEDGSIALWDVSESKVISKIKVHKEPVMSLDYSSLQGRGVSGSADETIVIWKLDESVLQVEREAVITNPGISDIKIRNDNKILAAAGWDSRIRIFGFKKLKPLAVLSYHKQNVQSLAFSPGEAGTERLIAAGSKDKHISLWSLYNQ